MSTSKFQTQDPTVSAEPVFGSNAMTVLEDRYLNAVGQRPSGRNAH